jgi:hypothetical protein
MEDVLPVVNILSKTMQMKDADFTNLVHLVPSVLAVLQDLEIVPEPAYSELEERLGLHGDLAGINLRYNHADNNVRANYHGSLYLAYLRRCLPISSTLRAHISSALRAHDPKVHKAHASYSLQEHLLKRFPRFLFWRPSARCSTHKSLVRRLRPQRSGFSAGFSAGPLWWPNCY